MNIPPTCTEREPSFNKEAARLFSIFLMEEATSSGICSTPTARPCGPTIKAKQAVRYPVPTKLTHETLKLCSFFFFFWPRLCNYIQKKQEY